MRLVLQAANRNRGFAYIRFANSQAYEKALAMDRQKIRNRPAFVSHYQDSSSDMSGNEKRAALPVRFH